VAASPFRYFKTSPEVITPLGSTCRVAIAVQPSLSIEDKPDDHH